MTHTQKMAKQSRKVDIVGFPKEWLGEDVAVKAFAGRPRPMQEVQEQQLSPATE